MTDPSIHVHIFRKFQHVKIISCLDFTQTEYKQARLNLRCAKSITSQFRTVLEENFTENVLYQCSTSL